MTSLSPAALVLVLMCVTSCASGSSIDFRSSFSSIKPLVSNNMTIRCALQDTSPTPTSPNAVVGKRSLTSLDKLTSDNVKDAHQTTTDSAVSHHDDQADDSQASVTSTADNVILVTSIILSRDGKDLATLIEHFPAKAVGVATGFQVTGQLTPGAREKGFLQVVWPHPTPQAAGNYRCDVATLSQSGHSVDFSQTLAVAEEEVTLADLVAHLSVQQADKEKMQAAIDDLKVANVELKQSNEKLNRTIDTMKKTDAAMNVEILKLKTDIFFSASLGWASLNSGQVVVYDTVSVNEGGAYSSSTGTFTCPISGYYHFEINLATYGAHYANLALKKNGNIVSAANTGKGTDGGNDYDMATTSVIVSLAKGDTIQVVTRYQSYLLSRTSAVPMNSFVGQLISLA